MRYLFLIFITFPCLAAGKLDLELGSVENSYNKVRVPGDDGTLFNLAPSFDHSNFYYRVQYLRSLKSRHGIRFLYAPLKIEGDRVFNQDIDFQGVRFSGNQKTRTLYKFNSYRGTYFYQLVQQQHWLFNLGATLKIRDAEIKLKQQQRSKSKANTGLVPLLYLFSEYKFENGFRLALDFDGLAAPQGRAFDVALMGGYYFTPSLQVNFGYRILEGGVDNDKVYNFSQFNFLFTSVHFEF